MKITPPRYRKKKPIKSDTVKAVSPTPVEVDASASPSPSAENGTSRSDQSNGKKLTAKNLPNQSVSKEKPKDYYFPPDKRSLWPSEFFQSATQPYALVKRHWRAELPHLFAVFFLVLLLYAFTSPQYVTLEDDGLFIANLKFFGVAHPPGYPIHTFLGGIFYHILPFGTPAFKGHFFSGFVGAIACAAIYATTIMLVRGRIFGYLAGLAYGASRTFWSQAIIAEVYTLNSMFFFIILALCVAYSSHVGRSGRQHKKLLFTIAFTYGLASSNHYPILALGSVGLFLLVFSQLRHIIPNIPQLAGLALLGLAPPYAWMVWRSYDLTPANFYGPIETWDQFLFYFLRSGYSGVDKQGGVGLEDKIIFSQHLADDMLWQFTPIGFVFVVLGFIVMIRSRYNWMWLSFTASWFISSVALIYLLDFKATYIWLAAFRVYHLLAYGIMAIWLALGAAWLVDKLRFIPPIVRQQVGPLIMLIVVGSTIYAHWDVNNRRDYRWAHDLAMAKINSIEANAVLFTFDDLDLPVGYLHYVEGVRPDLTIYNDQGLVHGNRLYSPLIPDFAPAGNPNVLNKHDILVDFINKTDRPIYHHSQRRELYRHPNYGSDFMGFQRRVNRDDAQERVILSDLLRQWLNDNVGIGDQITDLWTRQQHYSTVSQLINAVLLASNHGFKLDDKWQEIVSRARENSTLTRLLTDMHQLSKMDETELRRELKWAKSVDLEKEDLIDVNTKSILFILRANLVALLEEDGDDNPEYEQALIDGLTHVKGPGGTLLETLLSFYAKKERHCEFIDLVNQYYPDTSTIPDRFLRTLRQARKKETCTA